MKPILFASSVLSALLAIPCLLPLHAHSQGPEDSLWAAPASSIPGSFNFYFFPALPLGDFGDNGDNGGLATLGVGTGLEYFLPFGALPLGWVASAAVAVNPVDLEVAADIVKDQLPPGKVKVDGGTWLNIPFQTGLRVGGSPAPHVALHAQLLGGFTIVNQSDYTFTSGEYEAKLSPETAFTPGFMLGGGLLFYNRMQFGIRLFRTVKTRMKAKFSDSIGEHADQEGRIATTLLAFSLGVQF